MPKLLKFEKLNKLDGERGQNEPIDVLTHAQRRERLRGFQQELAQLAGLGRKIQSGERMSENHPFPHLVNRAS